MSQKYMCTYSSLDVAFLVAVFQVKKCVREIFMKPSVFLKI